MDQNNIIAVLHIHKTDEKIDLELPLDITANELIIGLNQAFALGMDVNDLSACFLRTEHPIAFLQGGKTLAEYGLRNGTVINHI